jgi:hypothetical protein
VRDGGKRQEEIEKERGKGELISPQWHLSLSSPLCSLKNLSDSSSASASYYGISRTT